LAGNLYAELFVDGSALLCDSAMELSVRDSAKLLNVSEKTVYRWAKQGDLPACRVNEQFRFNRAELLEWATSRGVRVSAEIFADPQDGVLLTGLADAIRAGGVHHRVECGDKTAALRSAVALMPLPREVDRDFVFQLLLARESLGSTAVGKGIALPHVRNPVVMHVPRPTITLCFLQQPIEFGALDGEPVTTLFTMLSPTVRAHLHTLARLSYALRQPEFSEVISRRGSGDEILAACEAVDRSIPTSSSAAH
jgi:PTS system nitrogen regulatory IIA component